MKQREGGKQAQCELYMYVFSLDTQSHHEFQLQRHF